MIVLAHGAAGGFDELFFLAAAGLFVVGLLRLLDKKMGSKRWVGLPLMIGAVAIGALPIVLQLGVVKQAKVRITSSAQIQIVSPAGNATITAGSVRVKLTLTGGHITSKNTTNLRPDEGHIHISIDGRLVSMTGKTDEKISLSGFDSGRHVLQAEFVAADHGPFTPRVLAVTNFVYDK